MEFALHDSSNSNESLIHSEEISDMSVVQEDSDEVRENAQDGDSEEIVNLSEDLLNSRRALPLLNEGRAEVTTSNSEKDIMTVELVISYLVRAEVTQSVFNILEDGSVRLIVEIGHSHQIKACTLHTAAGRVFNCWSFGRDSWKADCLAVRLYFGELYVDNDGYRRSLRKHVEEMFLRSSIRKLTFINLVGTDRLKNFTGARNAGTTQ
ncbi:hypothetical protein OESDEN_09958 [Oesophagostomum dentatum]|uniref:Uncharacterized protein n=1 Tax=Oesophagostomum dentatum TaxID=61180 RepID=A0A0B1T247_OESDE|nr:hypothetical protein OESDEN_09958 [Oesophagostomum dentatum]